MLIKFQKKMSHSQIPSYLGQYPLHSFDLRRMDPLIGSFQNSPADLRHRLPDFDRFFRCHQSFYTAVCRIWLTSYQPVPLHPIYKSNPRGRRNQKYNGKLGLSHRTKGNELPQSYELGRAYPGTLEPCFKGPEESLPS